MVCRAIVRKVGGVNIVDLSGRITIEGSGVVRDTVKRLAANGERAVVLNLAAINHLDSAGLGELVGSFVTVTNRGGTLKLLNVQKRVHDVLQVAKLANVFEAFTNEAEAVASFPKAVRVR